MSHPSLGLPPRAPRPGHPAAAAIRAARERLAGRILEDVVAEDATFRSRHDEIALRLLLRDTGTLLEQLADAVASGDTARFGVWMESLAPRFRKRNVPMDDLATLLGAARRSVIAAAEPAAAADIHAAIDAATAALKRHRRLAGDGKKRNPIAAFLYKGA